MAPAMNDLLGGQIAVVFPNITSQVVALHRAGKLRILAVNAPERLEAAPDIPTASEAGLPDFVSQIFFGLFARRRHAQADPREDQRRHPEGMGRQGVPEEAARIPASSRCSATGRTRPDAYLKDEFAKWGPVVQKAKCSASMSA